MVDRGVLSAADRADEGETGQTTFVVEKVLHREAGQPEQFPPNRLVFTAVPVKDARQLPACLLLSGSLCRGHCQLSYDRINLGEPGRDIPIGRAVAWLGPRHRRAGG